MKKIKIDPRYVVTLQGSGWWIAEYQVRGTQGRWIMMQSAVGKNAGDAIYKLLSMLDKEGAK